MRNVNTVLVFEPEGKDHMGHNKLEDSVGMIFK
jgi:hypothetical protein